MIPETSPAAPAGGAPPRARRWAARLALLAVPIALLWVMFETPWGVATLARVVVPIAWRGATLRLEGARGGLLTGIELHGVELTGPAGIVDATLDTLRLRYRPLELWMNRTTRLRDVHVAGAELRIARPLPAGSAERKPGGPPYTVVLDGVSARLTAAEIPVGADSILRARDLVARGRAWRIRGIAVTGIVDTLGAQVGGFRSDASLRVADLSLLESGVKVRRLDLDGRRSHVSGAGALGWGAADTTGGDSSLVVTFRPLAAGDLALLHPRAGTFGDLTLDGAIGSKRGRMLARLRAAFAHGGDLEVEGHAQTVPGAPIDVSLRGSARHFDLAPVTGDSTGRSVLHGTLATELHGPDLQHLDGFLDLVLDGSRWAGRDLDRARVQGVIEGGASTLRASALGSGFALAVTGSGRPLDPKPSGNLTATLQRTSDDAPRVGPGRLDVAVRDGLARWGAELGVHGGDARAAGSVTLDSTFAFEVHDGTVRGMSLSATDSLPSALDADFRMTGRRDAAGNWQARGTVTALSLDHAAHHLESPELNLELRGADASLAGGLHLDGSDIDVRELRIPVRPGPGAVRLDATWRGLDLARVLADSTMASDLNGRLEVRGRDVDLRSLTAREERAARRARADGRLTLERSTWRGEAVESLRLSAALTDGALSLVADLDAAFGRAHLRGDARPFERSPSISLPLLQLDSLDLGPLGFAGHHTSLTGRLSGTGRASRDTWEGDFLARFDGSRIDSVRFERLGAAVRIVDGNLQGTVEAGAGEDSLGIALEGRPFDDVGRLGFRGVVRGRTPEARADSLGVAADFAFEGTLHRPRGAGVDAIGATLSIRGTARSGVTRIEDMKTELALERGMVQVRKLDAHGDGLEIGGSGSAPLPGFRASGTSDLHMTAAGPGIGPLLGASLGIRRTRLGDGRIELTAHGPAGSTQLTGRIELADLVSSDLWADSLRLDVRGLLRGDSLDAVEATLDATSLAVGRIVPRDVTAHATWSGRELGARIHAETDQSLVQEIAFRLDPGDPVSRLYLDHLDFHRGTSRLTLAAPASIEFGARLAVDHLVLLQNGAPRLTLSGGVDPAGAADLRMVVDSLQIDEYMSAIDLPALHGSVSGAASLTGSGRRPVLACSLKAGMFAGKKPARIHARADCNGQGLAMSLDAAQTATQRLTLQGRWPRELAWVDGRGLAMVPIDGRADLELDCHRIDLAWLQPLLPPHEVRALTGWLDGNVKLEGTRRELSARGRLALTGGAAELPDLGVKYEKAELALRFEGRDAVIERGECRSGSGRLDLSGRATLFDPPGPSMDLTARWNRFRVVNSMLASAEVNGQTFVRGPLSAPTVTGELEVLNSTVYAEAGGGSRKVEAVDLTDADHRELRRRFGWEAPSDSVTMASSLAESTKIDVTVRLGDKVWVRRRSDPIVALELSGSVHARREPAADPTVSGKLAIQSGRSYLSFMGRRFELTSAEADLPGPLSGARARIEALYAPTSSQESGTQDPTVTAVMTLDAGGTELSLRSDPPLEYSALINYLATGTTGGEMAAGTAQGLAVGAVLGTLGGSAGRSLGFQVVQVTQDAYGGQTLSAGNYVRPDIYLGFRQPVMEGTDTNRRSSNGSYVSEFEIEVEAMRKLLINFQGGGSQYRLLFRPRLGR